MVQIVWLLPLIIIIIIIVVVVVVVVVVAMGRRLDCIYCLIRHEV